MHRIILEEIFLLFTNTKIKKVIKWEDKEKIRQIRTVHWVRNVSTKCLAFNCHFWEFRYIHLILLFYHRWVNLRRYFDFDLLPTIRGATGVARAPKPGKTPIMAARRRCRRRFLFFKIEVRPRSCRSYHIWRPCYLTFKSFTT